MRMSKGFGGKKDWKEAAERVLAIVEEDQWYMDKEIYDEADLRWKVEWVTVAYEGNLKIQHRTASWVDQSFGGNSVWRVTAR